MIAAPVLGVWLAFRWLRGQWGHVAIVLASVLVLLSAPGHVAAVQLEGRPLLRDPLAKQQLCHFTARQFPRTHPM